MSEQGSPGMNPGGAVSSFLTGRKLGVHCGLPETVQWGPAREEARGPRGQLWGYAPHPSLSALRSESPSNSPLTQGLRPRGRPALSTSIIILSLAPPEPPRNPNATSTQTPEGLLLPVLPSWGGMGWGKSRHSAGCTADMSPHLHQDPLGTPPPLLRPTFTKTPLPHLPP